MRLQRPRVQRRATPVDAAFRFAGKQRNAHVERLLQIAASARRTSTEQAGHMKAADGDLNARPREVAARYRARGDTGWTARRPRADQTRRAVARNSAMILAMWTRVLVSSIGGDVDRPASRQDAAIDAQSSARP